MFRGGSYDQLYSISARSRRSILQRALQQCSPSLHRHAAENGAQRRHLESLHAANPAEVGRVTLGVRNWATLACRIIMRQQIQMVASEIRFAPMAKRITLLILDACNETCHAGALSCHATIFRSPVEDCSASDC